MIYVIINYFPGLENGLTKFHDSPRLGAFIILYTTTTDSLASYRFSEAVISLCVAVIHQQLEAMPTSTNQPLRFLDVRRIELVQLAGLHVLKHNAVALQLQFSRIL